MESQTAAPAGSFFKQPAAPAPLSLPPSPPDLPPAPPRPPTVPPGPLAASAPGNVSGERRRLSFHGSGTALFGIHSVNVLLILLTLGIYYFWGKTRLRRYMFGQCEFDGDRFAYHGTARELLLGFAKAFVVFVLPIIALRVVEEWRPLHPAIGWAAAVLIPLFVYLMFIPVAMVGARRYRLSRTSWRGIRFSFRGSAMELIKLLGTGYLLRIVTFGLYYPFFVTRRQAFMVSHSYFGNERFSFTGRGKKLFGPYLLSMLLTLPTLGLTWFWFTARKQRFFWQHTAFGAARFSSNVTGGALLGLWLVNALLLIGTLGLAWPWVRIRNIHFAFRYLDLQGPLDLEQIRQQAQFASATGEGLAGFLDTGFDLG